MFDINNFPLVANLFAAYIF